MQDCKKFLKMAGGALVNQNALIMATSDDKGYDLEKYKKKALEEMEKESQESEDVKCNSAEKHEGDDQNFNTNNLTSRVMKEKTKSFEELMFGT